MSKGYHLGAIARDKGSETLASQGPGRSTGFFGGPGIYFFLDGYPDDWHAEREVFEIDLDKYNLMQGSMKLHEFLKYFTRFVWFYPRTKIDTDLWIAFAEMADDYSDTMLKDRRDHSCPFETAASNILYYMDEYDKSSRNYQFGIEEEYDHVKDLFNAACKLDWDCSKAIEAICQDRPDVETAKYWDNHYLFSTLEAYSMQELKQSLEQLSGMCGFKYAEVLEIAEKVYNDLCEHYNEDGYLENGGLDNEDTISARFVKWMGYDGIIPDDSTNNASYGGVIYSDKGIPGTMRKVRNTTNSTLLVNT